jgi:hypothetical protein
METIILSMIVSSHPNYLLPIFVTRMSCIDMDVDGNDMTILTVIFSILYL